MKMSTIKLNTISILLQILCRICHYLSWTDSVRPILLFSNFGCCVSKGFFRLFIISYKRTNTYSKWQVDNLCITSYESNFTIVKLWYIWAAPSEFGTYRICEQRRFRRACASAQSRQNLRCSLIQAVSQEEPSDRKPDPWPLWMAGHAQLKFVMTECSKTQIRLARPILWH